MVLPLFHNSLPVAPSRACRTAFGEFETAKTTPLTMMGGNGDCSSADVQPSLTAGESPSTFQAAMVLWDGATSQRVPAPSCQLVSAPEAAPGYPAPVSEAASTRWMWPSAVESA